MNLFHPISLSAANVPIYLGICHPWPTVPAACQLPSLTSAIREDNFLDMLGNGKMFGGVKMRRKRPEELIRRPKTKTEKIERMMLKLVATPRIHHTASVGAVGEFCGFNCRPICAFRPIFLQVRHDGFKIEANRNQEKLLFKL